MKKEIHTIPVAISFESGDECPFCDLERETEQRAIRYFAGPGASYMEPSVRELTSGTGFCGNHMKKLFEYGNPLGCALMMQSHMANVMEDLHRHAPMSQTSRKGLFSRKKDDPKQSYWQHLQQRVESCAICDQVSSNMDRHYRVFFSLLEEEEFRRMFQNCKGFCLRHFAKLLQEAEEHLPKSQTEWFYPALYAVMEENLVRVKQDLDWMVARYDYRNAGAPIGNSVDALQRTMQKMEGVYPAAPPYRKD